VKDSVQYCCEKRIHAKLVLALTVIPKIRPLIAKRQSEVQIGATKDRKEIKSHKKYMRLQEPLPPLFRKSGAEPEMPPTSRRLWISPS
jgi:hypothetical protein